MAVIVPLVQVAVGLGSGSADRGSGVYRMSIRRNMTYSLLGPVILLAALLATELGVTYESR